MEPHAYPPGTIHGCLWDTPEYWEKREAREKLIAAKVRAQRDRPRRKRRFKLAQKSRRRNRSA
jgi:hypothetical protein